RTHKALVENMYKKFFEKLDLTKKLHIAVLHGNALDKAEELAQRIQDEFNPVELILNITGPVLGINTGPGALALCGYYED
ncbi:MAG TPA: DegV family protein, partial [Opitutales bacterium]|nr:DegV family protein [Opitutales bacterium]